MRGTDFAEVQILDWEVDFNKLEMGDMDLNFQCIVDNLERTALVDIFLGFCFPTLDFALCPAPSPLGSLEAKQ